MNELKIEAKFTGKAGAYRQDASVRVIGRAIIARVPQFMLKEPKPATKVLPASRGK